MLFQGDTPEGSDTFQWPVIKRLRGHIKAYDMGQGEGPIVPLTVMHRKRVTSEQHDSYFRLMTMKHSI